MLIRHYSIPTTTTIKFLFYRNSNRLICFPRAIFRHSQWHNNNLGINHCHRRYYARIFDTAGSHLPKALPKTAKEVEERLLHVYYKHDYRKDYLHNQSSATHWCMGITPQRLPAFYYSLMEEFNLDFHIGIIYECKTFKDMHNHICTELQIPNELKTIRQEKAERKLAKEESEARENFNEHGIGMDKDSKPENTKTASNKEKLGKDEADDAVDKELAELLGYDFKRTSVSRQSLEKRLMRVLRNQTYINQEALDTAGLDLVFNAVGLDYKQKYKLIDALAHEFKHEISIPEFAETITNVRDVLSYYCNLFGAIDELEVDERPDEERIRGIRPRW